jgi:hypothetical protein
MRVASVSSHRRTIRLRRSPAKTIPLAWDIRAVLLVVFLLQFTTNIGVAAEESSTSPTPPPTTTITTTRYILDKDTRDDCTERAHECQTSATDHRFFLQCPMTCATEMAHAGGIGRTTKDPEEFFYPHVVTTVEGKEIALEDLVDGYVSLFAMIPMLHPDSGMAQYYYELLEHVATLFKYTLQIVVVPIRLGHVPLKVHLIQPRNITSSSSSSSSSYSSSSSSSSPLERRVAILEDTMVHHLPTFLSDFVLETQPLSGDSAHMGHVVFDRVSMYLLSGDTETVERFVSPTLKLLEERIPVYVNQLSARADL